MNESGKGGDMDHDSTEEHGEGGHLSVKFYVMIGLILAVVTAVEVAVYYIPAMEPVETPVILVLTAAKFALVVMFFMHLWIDSKVFTWLFTVGMVLASLMIIALVILYHFLPRFQI
jgi:cytochrome c oxidase subunit IV